MITQRHRRKCMVCDMRCQMLLDFGESGYLCKIGIHALVGYDRQHNPFGDYRRMILILFDKPLWNVKKRNGANLACFLSGLAYPHLPVVIFNDELF